MDQGVLTKSQSDVLRFLAGLPRPRLMEIDQRITVSATGGGTHINTTISGGTDADVVCESCGAEDRNYVSVQVRWRDDKFVSAQVDYHAGHYRRKRLTSIAAMRHLVEGVVARWNAVAAA